jgi:hypothetical protein
MNSSVASRGLFTDRPVCVSGPAFQTDTVAQLPTGYRLMFRAMALIPALRTMAQYQRYEF